MNDPLPRSQFKGLGESLSWDSKEGRRGALREYYFLTLIGPCRGIEAMSWCQPSKHRTNEPHKHRHKYYFVYLMSGLLAMMWLDVRGSLTCRASVIGSPDATCHSGAAWVSETQTQAEQKGSPVSWFNMHGYSDLTLRGQGWHTADRLGR